MAKNGDVERQQVDMGAGIDSAMGLCRAEWGGRGRRAVVGRMELCSQRRAGCLLEMVKEQEE